MRKRKSERIFETDRKRDYRDDEKESKREKERETSQKKRDIRTHTEVSERQGSHIERKRG